MANTKLPMRKQTRLKPGLREHVYAIIRVDAFHGPEVPIQSKVAVTKVMDDQAAADAEVSRLNGLQLDGSVYYFSQVTRLEKKRAAALTAQSSPGPLRISIDFLRANRTEDERPPFAAASSSPVQFESVTVVGKNVGNKKPRLVPVGG